MLFSFSITASESNVKGIRPDDFSVLYEWQEGSLPPPHHYEYRIRLQSSGQGEVTMTPDYPSTEVPVWTEFFTIHPDAVDEIYGLMVAQDLFTTVRQTQPQPLVGGSMESMLVTANKKTVKIPAFVISEQASHMNNIYSAINELVPEAIWKRLNNLRGQYVREYQQKR